MESPVNKGNIDIAAKRRKTHKIKNLPFVKSNWGHEEFKGSSCPKSNMSETGIKLLIFFLHVPYVSDFADY